VLRIACCVAEHRYALRNTHHDLMNTNDTTTLLQAGIAAAQAGAAEGSAPSLALAARATLADATLRDAPCMVCLQNAEALARRAIAVDPNNMEGHIHLAVSLGYQARIIGPIRARNSCDPTILKRV